MPRKDQGWITFQTSEEERQLLEEICQTSQRTKTEVLRELLRGLRYGIPAPTDEPESVHPRRAISDQPHPSETTAHGQSPINAPTRELPSPKPLRVSSRNVLGGKIKRVIKGPVSTEVTIEIVHRVELTSTITTTSAEALELEEGKSAYAVVKSSDVVIAME